MNADTSSPGLAYVHGAGLDTWIWERHARHVDAPTFAASFPGREDGAGVSDDSTLSEYADHVAEQLDDWPVDDVILVTHSIGGVVGLEVAERLGGRLVGFVGICAAIPRPGGSFLSCFPFHRRTIQRLLVRIVGTKPPDSVVRRSLCRGLSEDDADRVVDEYVPESRRLFTDSVGVAAPEVPTRYVRTTDDSELAPTLQEAMAETLGAEEVHSIEAEHMPMLSHPEEIAATLDRFVERY